MQRLIDAITDQILSDWPGFVLAVVGATLTVLARWLWRVVEAWRGARKKFSVSGYWVGECHLPSYPRPKLEIWRYVQRGHDVTFQFYDYDKQDRTVFKWNGQGVLRVDMCSLYYYKDHRHAYESGVLLLRLRGRRLKGIYAQFDPNLDDAPLFVSNFQPGGGTEFYKQSRVRIPWPARIRMTLGMRPFQTYAEAEAACSTPTAPAALDGPG